MRYKHRDNSFRSNFFKEVKQVVNQSVSFERNDSFDEKLAIEAFIDFVAELLVKYGLELQEDGSKEEAA